MVMFGGDTDSYPLGDTWLFGSLSPAATTVLGAGCAGTNGTPRLTSATPFLGNPRFAIDVTSARASVPGVVLLSPTAASLVIGPGCVLRVDLPLVQVPIASSGSGFASTWFTLPALRELRGAALHVQAAILDPVGPFGVVLSDARTLRIGD